MPGPNGIARSQTFNNFSINNNLDVGSKNIQNQGGKVGGNYNARNVENATLTLDDFLHFAENLNAGPKAAASHYPKGSVWNKLANNQVKGDEAAALRLAFAFALDNAGISGKEMNAACAKLGLNSDFSFRDSKTVMNPLKGDDVRQIVQQALGGGQKPEVAAPVKQKPIIIEDDKGKEPKKIEKKPDNVIFNNIEDDDDNINIGMDEKEFFKDYLSDNEINLISKNNNNIKLDEPKIERKKADKKDGNVMKSADNKPKVEPKIVIKTDLDEGDGDDNKKVGEKKAFSFKNIFKLNKTAPNWKDEKINLKQVKDFDGFEVFGDDKEDAIINKIEPKKKDGKIEIANEIKNEIIDDEEEDEKEVDGNIDNGIKIIEKDDDEDEKIDEEIAIKNDVNNIEE